MKSKLIIWLLIIYINLECDRWRAYANTKNDIFSKLIKITNIKLMYIKIIKIILKAQGYTSVKVAPMLSAVATGLLKYL